LSKSGLFDGPGLSLDPVEAFIGPEHEELRDRALTFCRSHLDGVPAPHTDDEARTQASRLVRDLGEAGLYAPIANREVRGCVIVREVLGWWSPLADAVFALQGLSATPTLITENDPGGWGNKALSGDAMGGFAMTEWEAGSDVAAMTTRAEVVEGGFRLSGTKTFISNAGIADFYVVFAVTDPEAGSRGVSAFLVPAQTPGFRMVRPLLMSAPHPLGEVTFEDCFVPSSNLLGRLNEGFKIGMKTLDQIRPSVAAAANGMAGRALNEAIQHAGSRRQFGRTLGSFQLIQDKLATMATELTAARLLTFAAAWKKDLGAERVTVEVAMAKSFSTEAAQRTIDQSVQVLGGRGVMADHVVDHLYRAVRALRIYEGTTEIQQLIIGGHLMKQEASS